MGGTLFVRVFRLLPAFSCCFAAEAQTPPPAVSGGISGIVLDAGSHSPLRRAVVTLSTVEAKPQDAVAWTDGNGRFSFGYLPAGRYQLWVKKEGYLAAAYGAESFRRPPATIQLAAGQFRNDFVFRLRPMTSITGVVLDDDGDPLPGVQVMAMRSAFRRQKRRLLAGQVTTTDSGGRYRFANVAPGQYAVVANDWNRPAVRMHPEATAGETPQEYCYGVQYFPGTSHAEEATIITVQPGQEISRIDFRLSALPSVSIAGKILVPADAGPLKDAFVNISRTDSVNQMVTGAGVSGPDNTFMRGQLTSGSYVLVAQASIDGKTYRAVQTVDLGPEGLHNIAIPLEAGIDLSGSVSVEGPEAGKNPVSFVNLTPGDDIPWNRPPLRAIVKKDGTFKITGVPPGVWDIGVGPIPRGGYLKSMQLGDQDVLTEEMAIRSTTSEALKIVVSTRGATIDGDAVQGDEPARGVVVLAPDGKFRHVTSFHVFAETNDKGHFEIRGATPGEYRLYAFEEFDRESIQDPDFLKPFEKFSVPVTLREGPNGSQKLSLIPAGAAQTAVAPASGAK